MRSVRLLLSLNNGFKSCLEMCSVWYDVCTRVASTCVRSTGTLVNV